MIGESSSSVGYANTQFGSFENGTILELGHYKLVVVEFVSGSVNHQVALARQYSIWFIRKRYNFRVGLL